MSFRSAHAPPTPLTGPLITVSNVEKFFIEFVIPQGRRKQVSASPKARLEMEAQGSTPQGDAGGRFGCVTVSGAKAYLKERAHILVQIILRHSACMHA
jgi:hypothetical protein